MDQSEKTETAGPAVTSVTVKESMDNFGALLQVLQEFVARTTRRHEISAEQVEPTDPNAN